MDTDGIAKCNAGSVESGDDSKSVWKENGFEEITWGDFQKSIREAEESGEHAIWALIPRWVIPSNGEPTHILTRKFTLCDWCKWVNNERDTPDETRSYFIDPYRRKLITIRSAANFFMSYPYRNISRLSDGQTWRDLKQLEILLDFSLAETEDGPSFNEWADDASYEELFDYVRLNRWTFPDKLHELHGPREGKERERKTNAVDEKKPKKGEKMSKKDRNAGKRDRRRAREAEAEARKDGDEWAG